MVASRMFPFITKTWNPVAMKCPYNCYNGGCWATGLKNGKLRDTPRYRDLGDKPVLIEKELDPKFKYGDFVFIEDMGDLFAPCVPSKWLARIVDIVRSYYAVPFLFLTKNPQRYLKLEHYFEGGFPFNAWLGATIETNRSMRKYSKAPTVEKRHLAMWNLKLNMRSMNRMIAIEPICDFDPDVFLTWLQDIQPSIVAIGYDNHKCKLPEPPLAKTETLIARLEKFTTVYRKTIRKAWNEAEGN